MLHWKVVSKQYNFKGFYPQFDQENVNNHLKLRLPKHEKILLITYDRLYAYFGGIINVKICSRITKLFILYIYVCI